MPPAVAETAALNGREERESLLKQEQGADEADHGDDDDGDSAPEAVGAAYDVDDTPAIVQVPQWRIQAALFLLAFKVWASAAYAWVWIERG